MAKVDVSNKLVTLRKLVSVSKGPTVQSCNTMSSETSDRMILKGYKRPLVQEDMWELDEKDTTGFISQRFEEIMKQELRKARNRLQKQESKKRKSLLKHQNSMVPGISQDVLIMVRAQRPAGLNLMAGLNLLNWSLQKKTTQHISGLRILQ